MANQLKETSYQRRSRNRREVQLTNYGSQEMLLSPIQQRLSNSLLQEQEVESITQTLALLIRMFWPSSITQPLLQSPLPLAMEQPELI